MLDSKQLRELLLQSLEHERGGVKVYESALSCAVSEDLKKEDAKKDGAKKEPKPAPKAAPGAPGSPAAPAPIAPNPAPAAPSPAPNGQ